MKILKKSFVILVLSLISVFTLSGCAKKFDGCIKDFSVDGEYIHLTFTDTHDKNYYFYPIIYIYKSDFSTYGCENLDTLLQNEDFIKDHQHFTSIFVAERKNGPDYKRKHSKEEIDAFSYWLFYDYVAVDSVYDFDNLPDDFNDVKDISSYTGWIKF